jgi:hypothetical protein
MRARKAPMVSATTGVRPTEHKPRLGQRPLVASTAYQVSLTPALGWTTTHSICSRAWMAYIVVVTEPRAMVFSETRWSSPGPPDAGTCRYRDHVSPFMSAPKPTGDLRVAKRECRGLAPDRRRRPNARRPNLTAPYAAHTARWVGADPPFATHSTAQLTVARRTAVASQTRSLVAWGRARSAVPTSSGGGPPAAI